jgi:hypothetical protein
MTATTAYTATFSNGQTLAIARSKRDYGFAYLWTGVQGDGHEVNGKGFAKTRELAQKAMSREYAHLHSAPKIRGSNGLAYVQYMRKLIADWKPGTVTFSEVVEVTSPGREGPALLTAILNNH